MKKLFRGSLLLLLLYLLLFPTQALSDARAGLLLWYHSVLPVLFPFMLLCGLLIRFGIPESALSLLSRPICFLFGCTPYGAFAVIIGFLCGFPMGAKLTCDLYRQGKISEREAYFLYGFVNNLSPSFILSFLAADQMHCPAWGTIFLFNILGSAFLYGLLSGKSLRRSDRSKTDHADNAKSRAPSVSVQEIFLKIDDCIYDTTRNAVRLGSYIVIFSLISGAVSLLLPPGNPAVLFLTSCIEVSNGVHLVASSALPLPLRFMLVSVLAAFGGLSALAQTVSVVGMNRRLFIHYVKSRVKITLLSCLFSFASFLFIRLFFLR